MVKNKEEIDIDYNNEAVREVYKYNANYWNSAKVSQHKRVLREKRNKMRKMNAKFSFQKLL